MTAANIRICVCSCCRNVSERRDIWLFESLTLFGLSSVVLVYHHIPLLLWLLATVTFVSATLTGRIDFVFYWDVLKTYWNEFAEQQESTNAIHATEHLMNSVGTQQAYKNQVWFCFKYIVIYLIVIITILPHIVK